MAGGTISLTEAIDIINKGSAFDIEFVTADKAKGTGGELRAYAQVVKSSEAVKGFKGAMIENKTDRKINPNHAQNRTVNIYVSEIKKREARIIKVHYRLITQLNGKDVI